MAEDRSYIEQNRAALARLRALVERLSDEQLTRPFSNGLTAAEVLAHVAFWDGRSLCLAERWDNGGPGPQQDDCEPENVDWIVAEFAVQLAERVDQKVAALTDEQLAQNRAVGSPLNVRRADHRLEHVEELEREFGLG